MTGVLTCALPIWQPSVQSAGLRSRLAVGHTPVRLSDALGLQLHPTSPSDPGLEGQTDLRKVGRGPAGAGSKGRVQAACSVQRALPGPAPACRNSAMHCCREEGLPAAAPPSLSDQGGQGLAFRADAWRP